MSLTPGTRLGPYEIVSTLGAGGMGEVYRARDTRLDRTVAVKVLPAHLAQSPELRQRFEREAKAISALSHPHICVLHDVGQHDGIDFLVMEYLDGESLADRLKKGALPLQQVLRYGFELADALDKAHRQGIVHRDLKPGNVVLTKSGAKLLDFGLAKLLQPGPPATLSGLSVGPTQDKPLTAQGSIMGTLMYMAPEQLEGREPDARTDLFALGTVLHEMATGQRAFSGKSQASLIAAILSAEPVPISSLQPLTPPALDRVVASCLAKDPDDRWQSARDLAAELRWISEGGAQAVPTAPNAGGRRGLGRLASMAAALVAALLGLALGQRMARRSDPPQTSPRVRLEIRAEDLTLQSGSMAVSADGQRIAFRAAAAGRSHLYVRALDSLTATLVPGTEDGLAPFWAPDGHEIAFMSHGKLKTVAPSGGPTRVLCDDDASSMMGGSWSQHGTIVFSMRGDLFRVPAGGGTPEQLGKRGEGETSRYFPQFLPDGRRYLYLSNNVRAEGRGIYVASLDSDERKRIVASEYNAAWASPGHLMFVRGDALTAQAFDAERLELAGEPFSVGAQPGLFRFSVTGLAVPAALAGYAVSSNGVLAWQPGNPLDTNSLTWFDRTGKNLGILGEPANYSNPALSPDDRSLAVDIREPQKQRDIWLFDLLRGGKMRLTFDPAEDLGAAWHPDSTRIAFSSERRGSREIYQKLANGSGGDELLLESKGAPLSVEDWSADGKWLVLNWRRQPLTDLFVLPTLGARDSKARPFLATEFDEDMGQFSPDGGFLAYRSSESGRNEVYVRDISPDGTPGRGKWQVSTDGGVEPRWRRDGRELFYVSGPAATAGLTGLGMLKAVTVKAAPGSFEAGVPKTLFEVRLPEQRRNRYVVTRDGQRFLVNKAMQDWFQSIQVLVNWLPAKR